MGARMFSINLDSSSTGVGLAIVVVASVAVTLKSLIDRGRWGADLFGYLDLADRLSRDGASETELRAARAIRDEVSRRAVDGVRRRRALKSDARDFLSAFASTICCSALALCIALGTSWGELSYLLAELLLMAGVVSDAVGAVAAYRRSTRPAGDLAEEQLRHDAVPEQHGGEHDEEPEDE